MGVSLLVPVCIVVRYAGMHFESDEEFNGFYDE